MSDDLCETKRCSKCGAIKPLREFHADCRYFLGVRGHCKKCDHAYQLSRYHDATMCGGAAEQLCDLLKKDGRKCSVHAMQKVLEDV